MVAAGGLVAASVIAGVGRLEVNVRAAEPSEAPDPAVAERTVVGEPGAGASVLPALRGLAGRLVVALVLGGAGAGVAAWGLVGAILVRRQESGPPDGGKDEQDVTTG